MIRENKITMPTEQEKLEKELGTPLGFGIYSHLRVLSYPNLKWYDMEELRGTSLAQTPGVVPVDLMVCPYYALREHSGTSFFSPPAQSFCTNYARGMCPFGSSCNRRHSHFAEVVCLDYLLGCCPHDTLASDGNPSQCEFYHRHPEGEALSMLSRDPTPEEFERLANNPANIMRLFPEQAFLSGGSGHWRRNGDNLTFKDKPPDYYIRCGSVTGTRRDGTKWVRHPKNDATARRFQEQ